MQLCFCVVVSSFLVCRRKYLCVAIVSFGSSETAPPEAVTGPDVGLPAAETAKCPFPSSTSPDLLTLCVCA